MTLDLSFFNFANDLVLLFFFFSSRRRHTRLQGDWSSDVCSSDLKRPKAPDTMDLPTQNAQRSNHRLTFRATRLETGHRELLRTGNGRVLPVPDRKSVV